MRLSSETTAADRSVARLVEAERVALLYRLTPRTLATAVAFSFIVFLTLRGVVSTHLLLPWLALNNGVTVVRFLDILAYRRKRPAPAQSRYWLARFVFLTAIAGSIWGLMGTLLYPHDRPEYQAIITVFVVGTAAVGLFTLNSAWIAYLALALPVLLPAAIYLPLMGGELGIPLGASIGFFALIVVVNSRTSVGNTSEMLTLRFENARIAEEREAALRAAEAAGRAKLQFLANMSHEIRTPLNGILGMTQLLRATRLDTQQQQRLDTVNASGEHLLGLLNDVLDFAKVEAGKLDIDHKPFELRRTLREVADLLAARAQERGLKLAVDIATALPEWVLGDAGRLKQVLNNLLGNAIKFTEAGSVTLEVNAEPAPEPASPSRIRFAVHDTGVGISQENQARLFEPFRQVDQSDTRRHGGTGLGLAISRQLVELMGGSIGVASQPGQGSVFHFVLDLPTAVAPRAQPAVATAPEREIPNARILLVEDNAVNREIALAMLGELGLSIAMAVDGREAVDSATQEKFDLILMDCQLPEIDGFEATQRIRQHEKARALPRVPIIALTANAIRGDRERCLDAGMDDYLAKPFRRADLQQALRHWLAAPGTTGNRTAPAAEAPGTAAA
ncbi:MAG: response regulator [Sterolibacteriaceae bacterium]|nr:response regulator [Candidatus Methylophosphatis haderslevensis]